MLSFCYFGEKQSEKLPQSRVICAFQHDGIWLTMPILGRHPVTPVNGIAIKNNEVNVCNFGKFKFCDYDTHQRGHLLGYSRTVKVDGDGAVFGCLRFYSSSEFLGSGMSHWDLFHIVTKKGSAGCPQPQRATIPRRAKHLHNGSSVNQVSRQKFAFDTSSRKVARENRNVKISHKEFHVCFLCFLFDLCCCCDRTSQRGHLLQDSIQQCRDLHKKKQKKKQVFNNILTLSVSAPKLLTFSPSSPPFVTFLILQALSTKAAIPLSKHMNPQDNRLDNWCLTKPHWQTWKTMMFPKAADIVIKWPFEVHVQKFRSFSRRLHHTSLHHVMPPCSTNCRTKAATQKSHASHS